MTKWIEDMINVRCSPYDWGNARMKWDAEKKLWSVTVDIFKPNTQQMKQNTTELLYTMLGYLSCRPDSQERNDLQARISEKITQLENSRLTDDNLWLWQEVMKFFNRDKTDVPVELYQAVARTIKELEHFVNQPGKKSVTNQESSCSTLRPGLFSEALNKYTVIKQRERDNELNHLKLSADTILAHAKNALKTDQMEALTRLLIEVYVDAEKFETSF